MYDRAENEQEVSAAGLRIPLCTGASVHACLLPSRRRCWRYHGLFCDAVDCLTRLLFLTFEETHQGQKKEIIMKKGPQLTGPTKEPRGGAER